MTTHHINLYSPGNQVKAVVWPQSHSHRRTEAAMETRQPQPDIFEIRLQGQLDTRWASWFDGLTITQTEDGDTVLTGPVVDQAALHGLLKKVRDLGIPLRSVSQITPGQSRGLSNETHSQEKGDIE
jgi:hypothetical protein